MLPLRDHIPSRTIPYVTYGLIALNVAVFFWERSHLSGLGLRISPSQARELEAIINVWGLVPSHFLKNPAREWPTLFASMFMHDPFGWAHLLGNMLFTWIFADNVEDAMGHKRFFWFWILCGLGAAAAQVLLQPHSRIPLVGASGAISGVLAGYALLYPRSPITVLNPVPPLWLFFGFFFRLPAWIVIAEYFIVNLFSALSIVGRETSGVGFLAHVGGFVTGAALARAFAPAPRRQSYESWRMRQ